jgi:hypothetical protein
VPVGIHQGGVSHRPGIHANATSGCMFVLSAALYRRHVLTPVPVGSPCSIYIAQGEPPLTFNRDNCSQQLRDSASQTARPASGNSPPAGLGMDQIRHEMQRSPCSSSGFDCSLQSRRLCRSTTVPQPAAMPSIDQTSPPPLAKEVARYPHLPAHWDLVQGPATKYAAKAAWVT